MADNLLMEDGVTIQLCSMQYKCFDTGYMTIVHTIITNQANI